VTITLTKIQQQILKLPVRLHCLAGDAEFALRAALAASVINHQDQVIESLSKPK
jgi:hypothetical protein